MKRLERSSSNWMERVTREIERGSETLILAGHLTVERRQVELQEITSDSTEDLLLVLDLDRNCPSLSTELSRTPKENSDRAWVAVPSTPTALEEVRRLAEVEVFAVAFQPTPSQTGTWRLACEIWQRLRSTGHHARLGLLVGDFQLPAPLRKVLLSHCLPADYRSRLKTCGANREDLVFLSEASARNRGKRRLFDPRRRLLVDLEAVRHVYRERGYVLLHNPDSNSTFLASDQALELDESPFLVALTQNGSWATCGLIVAGKFLDIAKQGFSHLVSVYDRTDDSHVRRKNLDGALIFQSLAETRELSAHLLTTECRGSEPVISSLDQFSTRNPPRPGRFADCDRLRDETQRRNLMFELEYLYYPGKGSRKTKGSSEGYRPENKTTRIRGGNHHDRK